jgi:hypothetical protein
MNPQESCRAIEEKIQAAQQLIINPSPETMERCLAELSRVATILEGLASGNSRDWNAEVHASFHRVRGAAQRLRVQIEQASNFWRGWIQLRLGTGYTRQGLPEIAQGASRSSIEA